MARRGFDRGVAAAEARLERLDDDVLLERRASDDGSPLVGEEASVSGDSSIHIENEWFPTEDDDVPEPTDLTQTDLADCIDSFAEVFNARDLDGVLELVAPDCEAPGLGNDVANFPEAVEDLWERRPTVLLTRGALERAPVGVLWELGEGDGWWRIATVHFSDVADGCAGVLAFSTDANLIDEVESDPPDLEFDEGTRWTEWDEGVTD